MSQVGTATGARRHDRIRICLPVSYGTESTENHGHAESISEGGLYINTNDVCKVGTRLIVLIEFPDRVVCHRGEVVWAIRVPEHLRDSMVCGMGISFTDADPQWSKFFQTWMSSAGALI